MLTGKYDSHGLVDLSLKSGASSLAMTILTKNQFKTLVHDDIFLITGRLVDVICSENKYTLKFYITLLETTLSMSTLDEMNLSPLKTPTEKLSSFTFHNNGKIVLIKGQVCKKVQVTSTRTYYNILSLEKIN